MNRQITRFKILPNILPSDCRGFDPHPGHKELPVLQTLPNFLTIMYVKGGIRLSFGDKNRFSIKEASSNNVLSLCRLNILK